ncbi:MAG TPA: hypothetical protein VEH00_04790 [Steroidobacteraceae bacterium]|nr:hypothetical protein [Steroidobacteraceae bacterium]
MLIRKRPPKPHAPGTPLLHENHPRPVTRRDFLAAGMLGAQGMVIGSAWLGAVLKAQAARAGGLDADIQALLGAGQCNIPSGSGSLPFIVFDLAGGANLVGSEALVGTAGGQANFLSVAGYGKLGLPGNMVPTSSTFVSSALGLLWHSDGAILRGIQSVAAATTQAGVNGAVIPAMSQNDTSSNTINPIYGIAEAGAQGTVVNLVGTNSSVSGGNSAALMYTINPALQPATIQQPSDAVALAPPMPAGGVDPLALAELESQARISTGTALYQGASSTGSEFTGALSDPSGSTPGVQLIPGGGSADAALKNSVRCAYVQSANTANIFAAGPSGLDPTQDPLIVGGTNPIFTAAQFSDQDVAMTASVMKLVIDGYAGAGTISLGGFDYHDGTRATGETRNFQAGQMIGAVLEYAARKGTPIMIQIMSDGSLNSNSTVDTSAAGRDKLGWQGDNSSVAATVFLVYSPKGRPVLRNGVAGQQIGSFSSDGSVVTSGTGSSPAANSVNQIPELIMLNYMGLLGTDPQFPTLFPMQGLGPASSLAALTVFEPIV